MFSKWEFVCHLGWNQHHVLSFCSRIPPVATTSSTPSLCSFSPKFSPFCINPSWFESLLRPFSSVISPSSSRRPKRTQTTLLRVPLPQHLRPPQHHTIIHHSPMMSFPCFVRLIMENARLGSRFQVIDCRPFCKLSQHARLDLAWNCRRRYRRMLLYVRSVLLNFRKSWNRTMLKWVSPYNLSSGCNFR